MKYNGYTAKTTIDEDQEILHGEIAGITDVVTFQGSTVDELKTAFRQSVDDYLDFCGERGEAPERPCSGRFIVRMSSDLHRDCALAASGSGNSLNAWVVSTLRTAIDAKLPDTWGTFLAGIFCPSEVEDPQKF